MIIKYKEPWCLNPDIISYGMNKGNILSFDGSKEYSFYIKFKLTGGEQDSMANIVWKGNDELGIQICDGILTFTFRQFDDQNDKGNGILKFVSPINNETDFEILISGAYDNNFVVVNGMLIHHFKANLIFLNDSTYNFGGGHYHNIEYEIEGLLLAKKQLYIDDIQILSEGGDISDDILGYYDFNKITEQKVWDRSPNFNLLNRFYL